MLVMQLASIFLNKKKQELKDDKEKKKELLREEMKRQIIAEELAKLKEENAKLQASNVEAPKEELQENNDIESETTPDE